MRKRKLKRGYALVTCERLLQRVADTLEQTEPAGALDKLDLRDRRRQVLDLLDDITRTCNYPLRDR
jgi:hypothetical protein